MAFTFQRPRVVQTRLGCSNSTLYLRISKGLWTKPVALGPRMSGWPESEVDVQMAAIIAGKTEAEIRALVAELEAARETAVEKFKHENMRTSTRGDAA